MILQSEIQIIPSSKTLQYYKDKGYNVKIKEPIYIKNEDIPNGSHILERRKCDNCSKEFERTRRAIMDTFNKFNKDLCLECSKKYTQEKTKITNLKKYGVEYPFQSQEIKTKAKETCLKKYGCEFTFQDSSMNSRAVESYRNKINKDSDFKKKIQEKTKATNLKKYGVENVFQNNDIKEKIKNKNRKKYGYDFISQVPEIREKIKQTNLKKYNVEYPLQFQLFKDKFMNTMSSRGKTLTSQPQLVLFDLCKNCLSNVEDVELNFPVSGLCLDISLKYKGILIDIEYDGWYWHQNKKKDYARDVVLKKYGYKILRVKSATQVPTIDQLIESLDFLANNNVNYHQIILSDWKEKK